MNKGADADGNFGDKPPWHQTRRSGASCGGVLARLGFTAGWTRNGSRLVRSHRGQKPFFYAVKQSDRRSKTLTRANFFNRFVCRMFPSRGGMGHWL